MSAPICIRCRVQMQRGIALENIPVASEDFGGDATWDGATISPGPEAKTVSVWKCPECGHSFKESKQGSK